MSFILTRSMMKSAKSYIHKEGRHAVKQNVLLFNQSSFAELIDIDETGATCRALMNFNLIENLKMDIELLNCDVGMHLKGISCRFVPNINKKNTSAQTVEETCILEFPDLSQQKREELEIFIEKSCRDMQTANDMLH